MRGESSLSPQVNTHPPATLMVHLIVIVPTLTTVDDQGHPVVEKYYKPGTTILLRCLVTNYRPDFPAPLWRREEAVVTESEKTRWQTSHCSLISFPPSKSELRTLERKWWRSITSLQFRNTDVASSYKRPVCQLMVWR